ncbi:putative Ig domain-containing protein, partial [Larkinella harenae]
VELTATGGSTYRWDNGATSPKRTITTAGTYSVTVTSGNGCSSSTSVVVTDQQQQLSSPNLASTTVTQGSPTLMLTATNCPGTLHWTGPDATTGTGTIYVLTNKPGTFVYQATCIVDQCASPTTTLSVIVNAPTASESYDGYINGADCASFRGWVWNAEQPNNPVRIDILNGDRLITTLIADQFRQDLLQAGKGNGRHGFMWPIPQELKDGSSLLLSARVSGHGFVLKDAPKAIICHPNPTPGQNHPPQLPAAIPALVAQLDVAFVAELPAFSDPEAQPLSHELAGLPAGLRFDSARRVIHGTPTQPGTFVLTYQATDPQGASNSTTLTLTVQSPTTSPVAGALDGSLYGADCETFRGWVWDRTQPNTPLWVELLDGTTVIATLLADQFRQDLLQASKGNGRHAFIWTIPASLKDGKPHSLSARVVNPGFILNGGPKTIHCQAQPAPVGNQPPQPPTPTVLVAPLTAQVGVPFSATLVAFTDPEGQPLQYRLEGLPPGLNLEMPNRTLSGTPTQAGTFVLTYQATDPLGASNSVSFPLTVQSAGSAPLTGNFEGFLDKLDCGGIRGWVWDRDKPNTPLTVEFYLETSPGTITVLGSTVANIYRQDLKDAGKGNGAHVYNFTPPASVTNGTLVFARVLGSHFVLSGSPKTYHCTPAARISAETPQSLQVQVLGNPVRGDAVVFEVRGAEGQNLQMRLLDERGLVIAERAQPRATALEHHTLSVAGQAPGVLTLQVHTPTQVKTVKLLYAN